MLHRNSDRVKKGANGIYDDDDKKMELSAAGYGEQDSIRSSRGSHRYHNQHAQGWFGAGFFRSPGPVGRFLGFSWQIR